MSGYLGAGGDYAAEYAIMRNENAIRAVLDCMPTGESAEFCSDCDEPIPAARQKAVPGIQYCVECAPAHERKPVIPRMFTYMP